MRFGIFQKIYEATEGSRVQKISNGKSSNAETVFPILAGFTEGSQGSWEWYMKVKKTVFFAFFEKKKLPSDITTPSYFLNVIIL